MNFSTDSDVAHPLPEGYRISTDPAELDVDRVHAFLSEESYWGKAIPQRLVEKSVEHSLVWGVYCAEGQVGFARVISDRATFAYVTDVFVDAAHRGKGLSKALVAAILAHPDLQDLRRWMLVTADAQKLYEQFGFIVTPQPERYMEILRPEIYLTMRCVASPITCPLSWCHLSKEEDDTKSARRDGHSGSTEKGGV